MPALAHSSPMFRSEPVIFPLMGSRSGGLTRFEYIPVTARSEKLTFRVPTWVKETEVLEVGEDVDLHMEFMVGNHIYDRGRVEEIKWDEALGSPLYRAQFHHPKDTSRRVLALRHSNNGPLEVSLNCPDHLTIRDLLSLTIKDSLHLKRGIAIHLDHLIPYFERISRYSRRDFASLRNLLLNPIRREVKYAESRLRIMYERIQNDARPFDFILATADLTTLRESMASCEYMNILKEAFGDEDTTGHRSPGHYLDAIQSLERKLYANYNFLATLQVTKMAA